MNILRKQNVNSKCETQVGIRGKIGKMGEEFIKIAELIN